MSTSEEAGFSEQAEVFHAPQPGCPRDRESSLEIPQLETGGTTEAGSSDEAEDGAPYLHPGPPTIRVDSPVRAEKKTDESPPDSGASRRQLSPAPGERHQLPPRRSTGHHRRHQGSPRSTERHPQCSRNRGVHPAPLDMAYAAARAQGALDDANQTRARRRRFGEDIEQAKTAAREASLVAKRAQQALAQSVASAATGAIAAPSPSSRPQVSHPSDHDPGTTPYSRTSSRAWRLHRG